MEQNIMKQNIMKQDIMEQVITEQAIMESIKEIKNLGDYKNMPLTNKMTRKSEGQKSHGKVKPYSSGKY